MTPWIFRICPLSFSSTVHLLQHKTSCLLTSPFCPMNISVMDLLFSYLFQTPEISTFSYVFKSSKPVSSILPSFHLLSIPNSVDLPLLPIYLALLWRNSRNMWIGANKNSKSTLLAWSSPLTTKLYVMTLPVSKNIFLNVFHCP